MIDAGPLTQEDADEYRLTITDTSTWAGAIKVEDRDERYAGEVVLTMTNTDALEMAAQLLIGAVYNASDSDMRERDWHQILDERIRAAARLV